MNYVMDSTTSERLLFRKLTLDDFQAWLPFHQDKRTAAYWSGLPRNPEEACQADFDRTLYRYENNLGGKLALLEKKTGAFVGLCGLLVQQVAGHQELEIAYSLLPNYWKKGYATEAAQQCKLYASEHKLAASLIAIIHIDNLPSQKVALNNHMKIETTTIYHDNPVFIFRVKI